MGDIQRNTNTGLIHLPLILCSRYITHCGEHAFVNENINHWNLWCLPLFVYLFSYVYHFDFVFTCFCLQLVTVMDTRDDAVSIWSCTNCRAEYPVECVWIGKWNRDWWLINTLTIKQCIIVVDITEKSVLTCIFHCFLVIFIEVDMRPRADTVIIAKKAITVIQPKQLAIAKCANVSIFNWKTHSFRKKSLVGWTGLALFPLQRFVIDFHRNKLRFVAVTLAVFCPSTFLKSEFQ